MAQKIRTVKLQVLPVQPTYVRTEDAMELMSVSRDTLEEWAKIGMVRMSKIGRTLYFCVNDLQNALTKNVVNAHLHLDWTRKNKTPIRLED